MSLRVCTVEGWMSSTDRGLDFTRSWFPRLVAERFVGSVRDGGDVDRAPDPLPFITADFVWTNTTITAQHVVVGVHRSSRSWVTTNPNAIALDDAVSWDVGDSPSAPRPSVVRNGVGGRVQVTRPTGTKMQFGYLFGDRDDGVWYSHVGLVLPDESLHFRYMGLFSTPGAWRVGESPRYEAYLRWVRLRCWAAPMVGGSV